MRVGVDLIEIERIRRALERYPRFRERCFTEAEQAYCESRPNPAAELRGPLRRQGSRRQGARLRRRARIRLARHRDRRTTEAVGAPERPARRVGGGVGAGAIDLSMTHSRELANAVAVVEDG